MRLDPAPMMSDCIFPNVLGDFPGKLQTPDTKAPKPDMQALRDICAGKIRSGGFPLNPNNPDNGVGDLPQVTICARQITESLVCRKCGGDKFHGDMQCVICDPSEIPICGKTWWEDGEHYECLMDTGLHAKHGLRGMVRRLDD